MRTYRLFAAVVVVLGVLLVACSQGPLDEEAAVVDFWHIQTYEPTKPVVVDAIARSEAGGGLTVRAQAIENDTFKTKLDTAFGARMQPDVFHTWGGGRLAEYVEYDLVAELTGKVRTEHLHPAALDFCRVDGKLYAVPVDVSFVPLWYNARLLEEAGVEPPRTMEELFAVIARLREAGVTPIALGNADAWPGAFFFIYLATRYGGSGPIDAGDFQNEAFVEAGATVRRLVEAGAFQAGFNGASYDDARRRFFNGEAAMMLMGTWLAAHAKENAPELLPHLRTTPFPGAGREAEWDKILVGGVNAGYAVSAATAHPEACVRLLEHLSDDTAMRKWAATGRLPALTREAWTERLGEPPASAEVLFSAPRLQLYYDQLLPAHLANEHKQTTQALFAGEMSPEGAAQAMTDAANR